jgi:hypothetical protein
MSGHQEGFYRRPVRLCMPAARQKARDTVVRYLSPAEDDTAARNEIVIALAKLLGQRRDG